MWYIQLGSVDNVSSLPLKWLSSAYYFCEPFCTINKLYIMYDVIPWTVTHFIKIPGEEEQSLYGTMHIQKY